MPTYQYACTECHDQFEIVQKFTDDSLTECPHCSGVLRKVFSAVGVVFKGSGFYRTDSRSSNAASISGSSSDGASGSGSSSGEKSSSEGASGGASGSPSGTGSSSTGPSGTGSSSAPSKSSDSSKPAASPQVTRSTAKPTS